MDMFFTVCDNGGPSEQMKQEIHLLFQFNAQLKLSKDSAEDVCA